MYTIDNVKRVGHGCTVVGCEPCTEWIIKNLVQKDNLVTIELDFEVSQDILEHLMLECDDIIDDFEDRIEEEGTYLWITTKGSLRFTISANVLEEGDSNEMTELATNVSGEISEVSWADKEETYDSKEFTKAELDKLLKYVKSTLGTSISEASNSNASSIVVYNLLSYFYIEEA